MSNPDEEKKPEQALLVERIQTGVRMEKRMLKVLKALAEYLDISLGDLLEGIVLHDYEDQSPFSAQTLQQIARLKEVYGMDYGLEASHHLKESSSSQKEGESDAL